MSNLIADILLCLLAAAGFVLLAAADRRDRR